MGCQIWGEWKLQPPDCGRRIVVIKLGQEHGQKRDTPRLQMVCTSPLTTVRVTIIKQQYLDYTF